MVVAAEILSLFDERPYSIGPAEREARLLDELKAEHARHYAACPLFQKICDTWNWQPDPAIRQLPANPDPVLQGRGSTYAARLAHITPQARS